MPRAPLSARPGRSPLAGLRVAAALSVAGHGLAGVLLARPWLGPAPVPPREVAASVEVVFGKNADARAVQTSAAADGAAAVAASPAIAEVPEARVEATLDAVPMPMPVPPSLAVLAAEASVAEPDVKVADGGEVGLDFKRGEEGVVEAASDPGNAAPRYPDAAVARRESGAVVWRMFIDSDGRVDHILAVQSSSYRDLDDAARVAFLRWHYLPARRGGVAVASVRDLTANFVLVPP